MAQFADDIEQKSIYEEQKVAELAEVDDWSSSWEDCKKLGLKWGGRGRGGRAAGRMTVQTKDVVLEGCTLAYLGNNLLERTTLRLLQGRRYGLIGRNGVGKSTLMSRIATGTLPGFPQHLVVAQVSQELPVILDNTINPVDYVVRSNNTRELVMKEIEEIEGNTTSDDPEGDAEYLTELYDMIEDDNILVARAVKILKDLGFSEKRREMPLAAMSGGWRMRVSIACALSLQPNILLLDEPTNHLDLEGVEWLKQYMVSPAAQDITILVTSHDRDFLDDICTDIIRFHRQYLHYYTGNYTAFEVAYNDKELNNQRMQEALDKQRKHMEETVRRMQIVASKSDSAQGAVASRKKKLARHGMEKNEFGHRWKAQVEGYKGRNTIRAGSQNETAMGYKTGEHRTLVDMVEREWKMTLPDPTPLSTLGSYLQIRNATIGYKLQNVVVPTDNKSSPTKGKSDERNLNQKLSQISLTDDPSIKVVLKGITLDIEKGSKFGIVGKNGCGKSTLLKLIEEYETTTIESTNLEIPAGLSKSCPFLISGSIYKCNHLRVAYYQQHQQESLPYDSTPLQYLTDIAPSGHNEQTLRAHLGSFGLSGDLALRVIGILSGGQKARLVLAQLTLAKPHILLLDEPTNNLDMDGIRALTEALKAFDGAIIITSHDMSFLHNTVDQIYHISKSVMTRLENVEQYKTIIKRGVLAQKNK